MSVSTEMLLRLLLADVGHVMAQNRRLLRQGIFIMSQLDDLKGAVSDLDDATNAVGARLDALNSQIKAGMSDAEVNDVKTSIKAEADRLRSFASDPSNPVPAPVPPAGTP